MYNPILNNKPFHLIPYTDEYFRGLHPGSKLINFHNKQITVEPYGIFTIRYCNEEKKDKLPITHYAWVIKHPKSYKKQLNCNSYGTSRKIALNFLINFIKNF